MNSEGVLSVDALAVSPGAVYAAMGYGGAVPDGEVAALVDEALLTAREIARPLYAFRLVPASVVDSVRVLMDGVQFTVGNIIGSYLNGMTKACVFVTSVGREYDGYLQSLKKEGDILREFVADSVGSVIAEACVDAVSSILDRECSEPHSLPYSPGYCAWNVKEQKLLFPLFEGDPCGVTLTDSCLMHPVKSVSGFIALGERLVPQPYRCEICTNRTCYKRRQL